VIAYTCDVRPSQVQAALLRDRISAGGRLLALHATNSAIDAPEAGGERIFRTPVAMPTFSNLLGNRFLDHPKIAEYAIEVRDPSHALVKGLSDFRTTDEIYVSKIADDLHVILDTEYDGPCPGFETESVPGRTRHPILYTRPQGDGEVTYFTLGHCRGRFDISDMGVDDLGVIDRIAWDSPEFLEIMRRSVAWAVHGNQWSECSASRDGAAA
jgi:type 1 glutamine amidotransferase